MSGQSMQHKSWAKEFIQPPTVGTVQHLLGLMQNMPKPPRGMDWRTHVAELVPVVENAATAAAVRRRLRKGTVHNTVVVKGLPVRMYVHFVGRNRVLVSAAQTVQVLALACALCARMLAAVPPWCNTLLLACLRRCAAYYEQTPAEIAATVATQVSADACNNLVNSGIQTLYCIMRLTPHIAHHADTLQALHVVQSNMHALVPSTHLHSFSRRKMSMSLMLQLNLLLHPHSPHQFYVGTAELAGVTRFQPMIVSSGCLKISVSLFVAISAASAHKTAAYETVALYIQERASAHLIAGHMLRRLRMADSDTQDYLHHSMLWAFSTFWPACPAVELGVHQSVKHVFFTAMKTYEHGSVLAVFKALQRSTTVFCPSVRHLNESQMKLLKAAWSGLIIGCRQGPNSTENADTTLLAGMRKPTAAIAESLVASDLLGTVLPLVAEFDVECEERMSAAETPAQLRWADLQYMFEFLEAYLDSC